MSDVLVVLPSYIWGTILRMFKESEGHLEGIRIWGDGHVGESLREYLDKNLSEMMYDENVHIVTRVKSVEIETRCPYRYHEHKEPRKRGHGK